MENYQLRKKYKIFWSIHKFGDIEIKKQKFDQHKRLISVKKYRH